MKINTSCPVLVTGATGYIAGWVVKNLLDKGITVHAPIRNLSNKEKRAHLDELAEQYNNDAIRDLYYFDEEKGGFVWNQDLLN